MQLLPVAELLEGLGGVVVAQYRQLARSAPAGAVLSMRFKILGRYSVL